MNLWYNPRFQWIQILDDWAFPWQYFWDLPKPIWFYP